MFVDHSQRRATVGRTPPDEWSVRRRDLYLTTHNTHNRQTSMPPGGIRTQNLSRRAAVELRLRRRGYRDRLQRALLPSPIIKMAAPDTAGKTIFLRSKIFPEGTERFVQGLSSLGWNWKENTQLRHYFLDTRQWYWDFCCDNARQTNCYGQNTTLECLTPMFQSNEPTQGISWQK